jgi:hypothetical protein
MLFQRFLRIQFERSQRSFHASENFFLFKSFLMSSLAGRIQIASKVPLFFEVFSNSVFLVSSMRSFVISFSLSGGLQVLKRC